MTAKDAEAEPTTTTATTDAPPAYADLPKPSEFASGSGLPLPVTQLGPLSVPFPTTNHGSPFGPTPINSQTHLIRYYDSRSPAAVAESHQRAGRRFLSAFLWAIFITLVAGALLGGGTKIEMDRRRGSPY